MRAVLEWLGGSAPSAETDGEVFLRPVTPDVTPAQVAAPTADWKADRIAAIRLGNRWMAAFDPISVICASVSR